MKYLSLALLLFISLMIFGCTQNIENTASTQESQESSIAPTPQRVSGKYDQKIPTTQPIGPLKRKVADEVLPQDMNKTGKVVFNICINREGDVVYTKYNLSKSTLTDRSVVLDALSAMKKTTFQGDSSAPGKECGQWTIDFTEE